MDLNSLPSASAYTHSHSVLTCVFGLPGAVGAALEARAAFLALETGRSSPRRRYPRMPRALSSPGYFLQGVGGEGVSEDGWLAGRVLAGEAWEGYKRAIKGWGKL